MIKKIIRISEATEQPHTVKFWLSKNPEERVEALETIREHYYSMLGYTSTPRIKKSIRIS